MTVVDVGGWAAAVAVITPTDEGVTATLGMGPVIGVTGRGVDGLALVSAPIGKGLAAGAVAPASFLLGYQMSFFASAVLGAMGVTS